jgi:cytochrome c2
MAIRQTKSRVFHGGDTPFHTSISVVSIRWAAVQVWIVMVILLLAVASTPAVASSGGDRGGDANKGRAVLERTGCLNCHSLDGTGDGSAGDLALRSIFHRQSPSETAAEMWNHAPKMWELIAAEGKEVPRVTLADAENVYAFFRSSRYFDPRGEVIRGKAVFSDKGCGSCHYLGSDSGGEKRGPRVSEWSTQFDTASWTSSLWNHAETMLREMDATGKEWPTIS